MPVTHRQYNQQLELALRILTMQQMLIPHTTTIGEITQSLGALSGSLTSLKAYQNVATTTKAHLIQAASNLQDTDFAVETAKITKQSLIRNYALAMVATANSEELEKLKLLA